MIKDDDDAKMRSRYPIRENARRRSRTISNRDGAGIRTPFYRDIQVSRPYIPVSLQV
jgi:hypothetical protein